MDSTNKISVPQSNPYKVNVYSVLRFLYLSLAWVELILIL